MFIICVSYIIKINYFPEKRRESSQKLNNLFKKHKSRNLERLMHDHPTDICRQDTSRNYQDIFPVVFFYYRTKPRQYGCYNCFIFYFIFSNPYYRKVKNTQKTGTPCLKTLTSTLIDKPAQDKNPTDHI